MARTYLAALCLFVTWFCYAKELPQTADARRELGAALFNDRALSADGRVACSDCHRPEHAFSDDHPRSTGAFGRIGNRNAPSLLGVGTSTVYFWDGRRTRLEDAVHDPFFMPFELGLRDERDLLERLDNIDYRRRFEAAFPDAPDASMDHVEAALASYLRSLANDGTRPRETSRTDPTLDRRVAMGKRLFFGKAQCVACHEASADSGRYTDDRFHPSALGTRKLAAQLPQLVPLGMSKATDVEAVGRLSGENRDLAELGRFLVDKQPAHVNAFRTPSLLNVAATAPYMHDGSVATLEQAVDLEIYYRGLESGRPLQLTSEERTELVFFLKTLRTP